MLNFIDWGDVIISSLAGLAFGFIWYSEKLFGVAFATETKSKPLHGSTMTSAVVTEYLCLFVMALIINAIVNQSSNYWDAFLLASSFVAMVITTDGLRRSDSRRLLCINLGYGVGVVAVVTFFFKLQLDSYLM